METTEAVVAVESGEGSMIGRREVATTVPAERAERGRWEIGRSDGGPSTTR